MSVIKYKEKIEAIKNILLELNSIEGIQFSFKITDEEGDGIELMNINNLETIEMFHTFISNRWKLLKEYERFLNNQNSEQTFRVVCVFPNENLNVDETYRVLETDFSLKTDEFLFKLAKIDSESVLGWFSSNLFVLDNYTKLN